MNCRAEITIKIRVKKYYKKQYSSVSTSSKAGVGSLEDPTVLLLKINTHTHTSLCKMGSAESAKPFC